MGFYILHPRDLEKIRKEKNVIVVDLREWQEYDRWHYRNAVCLPYCDSESWLNQFCKAQNYVLYCDYGNVSLLVARKLAKRNMTVYTVLGGAKELKRFTF